MKRLFIILMVCLLSPAETARSQESESPAVPTQQRIENFERRMKNWGSYYEEMAGAENLGLGGDEDVVGEGLLIYGGDWAVFDRRLCSGPYGVSHESGEIWPIELVSPEKYDTSCIEPKMASNVSTLTLMKRYQWFSGLFMNWAHFLTPTPFGATGWETAEDIDADYAKEITELGDDPYLALYWLMHFGFTFDERYHEVKGVIEENALSDRLEFIDNAIAFFSHQPFDTNVEIENSYSDEDEFIDIFLKRRAYLLWIARSYRYASGADGVDAWWKSITLYPEAERYMIRRMRWLGNNVEKFDQWQAFSESVTDHNIDDVSLLSYVKAQNPMLGTEDRQRYADRFISELVTNEQLWKGPTDRKFGQVMIWKLRDQITDKALLQDAVDIYFSDDTISETFQDINAILHGEDANTGISAVRGVVEHLHELAEGFDAREATDAQREEFYRAIDEALHKAQERSVEVLFDVIANLDGQEVQKRALHYLYTRDIPQKEGALTALFIRMEPSRYDIAQIFADRFPKMFEDANDPDIAWAKDMLLQPDAEYRNAYAAKRGRRAVLVFFLDAMHWDQTFAFFIDILRDEHLNTVDDLKHDIFSDLFSREYETKINPTDRMSQVQLETVLETVSEIMRKRDWYLHGFINEARRTLAMENPKAKAWLELHHNNREWLQTFPDHVAGQGSDIREDINWSIGYGLELIEENETK